MQLKSCCTPHSTTLLAELQIVPRLVKKFPPICGTEGSVPRPQLPATDHPEPD